MSYKQLSLTLALTTLLLLMASCSHTTQPMHIQHTSDTTALVQIRTPQRYLLLPIQESKPEVLVRLIGDRPEDTALDIHLAVDSIDYFVPLALPMDRESEVQIIGLGAKAIAWDSIRLSDTFTPAPADYYRPTLHYTPPYGWMNDPNGLVYLDGRYHLYYQYNPYGAKWGNMYWGHASSEDLLHWQTHEPALARDTLGHIFSGSAIIDREGQAGFGKGALLAFYTAHKMRQGKQWQAQCLAYSTDQGMSFTKYTGNPILSPHDGISDFRDPKVFWYAPNKSWYMIVSADKEMRFYRSTDLRQWDYASAFGDGYGARPCQFECPDFFELPMEGTGIRKWVMLVNINPGGVFGGSATEYFVGSFDGETFTPDTAPEVARWLDFGKDHYAFVTFHGTPGRVLGIPWASNWQYANVTPFKQSRGVNGLPRELFLFEAGGRSYVGARPATEVTKLRKDSITLPEARLSERVMYEDLLAPYSDSFELELELTPEAGVTQAGVVLTNNQGDRLPIFLDLSKGRVVMDRTQSGLIAFGEQATPHERESADWRKGDGLNYQNDFALSTWAPLGLCARKTYRLRLFIDRSLAELFVEGGRIAMTNLIFPRTPYTSLELFSEGGSTQVRGLRLYRLGL